MLAKPISPVLDADTPSTAPGHMAAPGHILRPGRNVWRVERADRAAILIDAAAYFGALRKALLLAERSVQIIGWDVDSRAPLVGPSGEVDDDLPRDLGPFLTELVARKPELEVKILLWDYSLFFTSEREAMPAFALRWRTPEQIELCLDDAIPLGSSHHQKIVVIDGSLAFCGGLDLTIRRWDNSDHDPENPHRVDPAGKPYRPFHDIQMMVDGPAACALAELARERWQRAAVETLPAIACGTSPWPQDVKVDFRGVTVGIARTEPPYANREGVREVETLFHDMASTARTTLYIENQYLTCLRFARVLARALSRNPGLEAIIIGPSTYGGYLERAVMLGGRSRIAWIMRRARVSDRVFIAAPRIAHNGETIDKSVHAKLMIVDDRYLRAGSANLCNRSMGTDTECDLTIAGEDEAARQAILDTRDTLIAEHCGATVAEVRAAIAAHGSVIAAIESLPKRAHGLHRVARRALGLIPGPALDPSGLVRRSVLETVADPRLPIDPTRMLSDAGNAVGRSRRRPLLAFAGILLALALFLGLAAAWNMTPLGDWLGLSTWTVWMESLPVIWAALAVVVMFVLAGLVMFPVMVLIVATAAMFGMWPGMAYAFAGALASAMVTYSVGRWQGARGLRQFFGPRINLITRSFAQQGVPAVTLVRLVPVAPFSIINLAAGAIGVPALDYLVGTAIGLAPGLILMSVLGEQAIALIREPTWGGIALLIGLLGGAIGISIALQRFLTRRRAADGTTSGRRIGGRHSGGNSGEQPSGRRLSENMP